MVEEALPPLWTYLRSEWGQERQTSLGKILPLSNLRAEDAKGGLHSEVRGYSMERERFEQLVAQAVASLPEEFRSRLENIDVVVADKPTYRQLRQSRLGRGNTLLGLYEGVPLTERGSYYGMVVPDKITVFQEPIVAMCRSDADIKAEVRRVVQHEIAHHFGIGDARLEELEGDS